jgi:hypothetical protein
MLIIPYRLVWIKMTKCLSNADRQDRCLQVRWLAQDLEFDFLCLARDSYRCDHGGGVFHNWLEAAAVALMSHLRVDCARTLDPVVPLQDCCKIMRTGIPRISIHVRSPAARRSLDPF